MARLPLKKVKGQRAVALCPLTATFGQFSVSKLIRDVALFVHLAIRALWLDSVAATCPCPGAGRGSASPKAQ